MPDWTSYTLSDFLMFSPRVYFRLIERYNQDLWPLQLILIAAALLVLIPALHVPRARIAVYPTLAAAWAFCAWQFLWIRYAAISWATSYAAIAFLAEAGLLALWSGTTGQADPAATRLRQAGGIGLMLFGLLAYPFLALLAGRSLASAETFAMMPDPTATATLGAVLAASRKTPWLLLPMPLLWCGFSGLTLWALEDPGAWAPFASIAATLALLLTPAVKASRFR
ncbi:DUF6064 family protein [Sinorhizobium numidicum]|uniref:DUF6064 family protein n=1 Tax=Sinorhizobium numidicum TaxID=680248 RepID=A0ABY8CPQ4_9HYPH|nr:DUF6064 family protein [Sinorhizobium numidicum]WEX74634.1 DUF6064 family protein [Sinorhizobium numidicum]WEX80625.1 DUF6064 family protein [Sinorhizobium numidicum]